MKKLHLKFEDDALTSGLEAQIAVQNDEPFINKMLESISAIRKVWEDNKKIYGNSESLFTLNKSAKDLLAKLNDTLNKRIGINFIVLPDITGNACVFPVTAENFNVLNEFSENNRQAIVDQIELLKTIGSGPGVEYDKNAPMSMQTTSGFIKIFESMLHGVEELNKLLNSEKVEFDLKNAKIKNLPATMMSVMAVDFVTFFASMTDREILSIIMHETGHQYTHLLNMYRKVKTNTILKDAMKFGLEDKIDKISITFKQEFNVELPKLNSFKTSDNVKEVMVFMEKLTAATTGVNGNYGKMSSRDSEALADQFATHFGLGADLFTALNKISTSYNDVDFMLGLPIVMNFLYTAIFIAVVGIVLLLSGMLLGATFLSSVGLMLVAQGGAFIQIAQIASLICTVVYFLGGEADSWEMVYDDKKRRLERIRNDSIRVLRGISASGIDKNLIKSKIDEIEEMEKIIFETRKGRSLAGILGEIIFPWNRKHSTETLIQQTLENLEANKLQILSEKLK